MPSDPTGGAESFDSGYEEWNAGRAAIGSPYHTRHRKPMYQHIHPPVHYDDGILPPIHTSHGITSPYVCNSPICESPAYTNFMPRRSTYRPPPPPPIHIQPAVVVDREKPKSHVIVVRRPPPRPTHSMYRFGGITLPFSLLTLLLAMIHLIAGLIILVVVGFQWDTDADRINGLARCDQPLQTWLLVLGISCCAAVIPSLLASGGLFKLYGNYKREMRSHEPGTSPPDIACGMLATLFLVFSCLIYIFELAWFMIGNMWFYRSDRDLCSHVWTFSFITLLVSYGIVVIVPLIAIVVATCWLVDTATKKDIPHMPPPPTVVLRTGGPPRGSAARDPISAWTDLDSTSSDDYSDNDMFPTRAAIEQQAAAAAIQAGRPSAASSDRDTPRSSRSGGSKKRKRAGGKKAGGKRSSSAGRGRSAPPSSRRPSGAPSGGRSASGGPGGASRRPSRPSSAAR